MNMTEALYFPSKVIMVDDNDAFLANFSLKLSDHFKVDVFVDTNKAIDEIRSNYINNVVSGIQSVIKKEEDCENDFSSFMIDFNQITNIQASPNKDKVISAIIVDYSMPIMDGITFCKELSDLPVPKIMLTGHADFQLAVEAFNKGLINQFIVKDSPNMYEQLVLAIQKCQREFFKLKSYPIINAILSAEDTVMSSDEYYKCLQHVLDENDVVEYYLFDTQGSYLLINKNREKMYFQAITEKNFDEYINIAENAGAAPTLLKGLRERLIAPLFVSENERQLPVAEWKKLLQPVMKLNELYYILSNVAEPNTSAI